MVATIGHELEGREWLYAVTLNRNPVIGALGAYITLGVVDANSDTVVEVGRGQYEPEISRILGVGANGDIYPVLSIYAVEREHSASILRHLNPRIPAIARLDIGLASAGLPQQ